MQNKISIIIPYCSIEKRFIEPNLTECLKISLDVNVIVSDHLFNGELEDIEHIKELKSKFNTVNFIMYEWDNTQPSRYWHNVSRLIGIEQSNKENEWCLFLDSDEIINSSIFNEFFNDISNKNIDSYKLSCFYYFRQPTYQSTSYEDSTVLVRRNAIQNINLHSNLEREQFYDLLNVNKKRGVLYNGTPMIHHFSWVRTKHDLIKKVTNWGHKNDKDWVSLVEEEYSRAFNGRCFVHNYEYIEVKDFFNLGEF